MAKIFFSFAGVDHDGDMDRFCGELFDAVAQNLGGRLSRDDVAFRYTDAIGPGEQWPPALVNALAECKVFLYARSPTYFATEACGREWSCFAARVARGAESLMVPISWVPLRYAKLTLPQPIADAYLGPDEFGAEYHKHGLKRILFKRDETAYRDYLGGLCDYLCQLLNNAALKPADLERGQDFRKLPNAFLPAAAPSTNPSATSNGGQRDRGEIVVRFAIAAGTQPELRPLRRIHAQYDFRARTSWRPFMPTRSSPIWKDLTTGALALGMRPDFFEVDAQLLDKLRAAEREDCAVVVVDPWSLQLPVISTALSAIDAANLFTTGVLVPRNTEEDEVEDPTKRQACAQTFRATFFRSSSEPSPRFRNEIDATKFDDELVTLLEYLRGRIVGDRIPPPTVGGTPTEQPMLTIGPANENS